MVFTIDELSRYTVAQRQELYKIQIAELQAALMIIDVGDTGLLHSQIDALNISIAKLELQLTQLKGVVIYNNEFGSSIVQGLNLKPLKTYEFVCSVVNRKSVIEDVAVSQHYGKQSCFFTPYVEGLNFTNSQLVLHTLIHDYTITPETPSLTTDHNLLWIANSDYNYISFTGGAVGNQPLIYKIIEYDKEF